jgi:riboflavin synthase
MFTGIIREIGTVARVERSNGVVRLTVSAPRTASRAQPLDSVSVNGVCLSVVRVRTGAMTFEVIPETHRATALGTLSRGSRVNLEPSLSVSDRLGGHLVFGHVDGVGTIAARRQRAGELAVEIRVAPALRRFLVPKGPVTVDGVSLTVGRRLAASRFTVHLIPETLRQTTLASRRVGDRVNLEIDYFAKLIWQFHRSAQPTLTGGSR